MTSGGGTGGSAGSTAGCTSAGQCNDDNVCTDDSCDEGTCANEPVADGDAPADQQTDYDCQRVQCIDGNLQSVADDSDLPNDDQQCTDDLCVDGSPSNPALAAETACDEDGGTLCNDDGECVECYSNTQCTAPETCGGGGTPGVCGCTPISCGPTGANLTCGFAAQDGCGSALDCNNNTQDGTETDVDCGGSVTTCSVRCNVGQGCVLNSDCATDNCNGTTCEA